MYRILWKQIQIFYQKAVTNRCSLFAFRR